MLRAQNFITNIPNAAAVGATLSPLNAVAQTSTRVFWSQPVGGTTISTLGGVLAGTGTVNTAFTPGTGNNVTRWRRSTSTGASAINSSAGFFTQNTGYSRSSTGGFDARIHFAIEANATGHGAFVGMSTLVAAITTATPSALTNCVGVGFDAADANTGTWFLLHNDGSGGATKTPITGMTRTTTESYVLRIICPQGATANITVSIYNATTGVTILPPTVLTSDLPATNTTLAPGIHMRTDGVITTAAVVSSASIYIVAND